MSQNIFICKIKMWGRHKKEGKKEKKREKIIKLRVRQQEILQQCCLITDITGLKKMTKRKSRVP